MRRRPPSPSPSTSPLACLAVRSRQPPPAAAPWAPVHARPTRSPRHRRQRQQVRRLATILLPQRRDAPTAPPGPCPP